MADLLALMAARELIDPIQVCAKETIIEVEKALACWEPALVFGDVFTGEACEALAIEDPETACKYLNEVVGRFAPK